MRNRAKRQAGFTLVELLVAMTALGLLSVALLEVLHQGFSAWGKVTRRAASMEEIRVAQELLHREFTTLYPLWIAGPPGSQGHVDFTGSRESADFLAPIPATLLEGGHARYHLSLKPRDGHFDLVMSVHPELAWPDSSIAKTEVLVSGLQSVELAYYGPADNHGSASWQNNWQDRTELPHLIRLSIRFSPGDTRYWPELVAKPYVTVDAACVFEPVTRSCRGR